MHRPVSLLQILLTQMKTCIASCGLWAVAILKSLLCLSAGPLQDSTGFSIYEDTAVCFFFPTVYLHLLDCSVTWSLLTLTDADWTCWFTVDSLGRKHKHKFETDSDRGHTIHRLYTSYKQYTACCTWCVNDGRTAASSAAVSGQHHDIYTMSFTTLLSAQIAEW